MQIILGQISETFCIYGRYLWTFLRDVLPPYSLYTFLRNMASYLTDNWTSHLPYCHCLINWPCLLYFSFISLFLILSTLYFSLLLSSSLLRLSSFCTCLLVPFSPLFFSSFRLTTSTHWQTLHRAEAVVCTNTPSCVMKSLSEDRIHAEEIKVICWSMYGDVLIFNYSFDVVFHLTVSCRE